MTEVPAVAAFACNLATEALGKTNRPMPSNAGDLNDDDPVILTVGAEAAGLRFDAYLAKQFPAYSRVQLRRIINATAARVDGLRCKAAHRLRGGEQIEIRFPSLQQPRPEPEDIPLDILFEDDHLIVVNKPHAMVVHPSKGHWSGRLTGALTFHFNQLSQVGGPTRPGIVHRLDRDTSGAIVIAKTDFVHLDLSKQFELRAVEKEYLAISRGTTDRDRDEINQPIGVHPTQREKMAIRVGHTTSRQASTFYEVVERFERVTVFRVKPLTGRTHQIRVHLSHIGCPILCDPLYSGQKEITSGELLSGRRGGPVAFSRLALHARRIRFVHPVTHEPVEIKAKVPREFDDLLALLRSSSRM